MKRITALLALASICICLAGCGRGGSEAPEVRVAYFPNITHAQALVMKNRGMLEEAIGEGVAVRWIAFNAGPAVIEALFAGEIDISYIGPVPAINGYVQSGGDLRIIAGASNGGSVLVAREGADIGSAADLDGKVVAIPQYGNTQHLNLLGLLSANGLGPVTNGGTVEIVQSSNADIAGLMDQGHIDAAFVPEPWGSILEIEHGAKVVLDYDEVDENGIPSTALVIARKDFLDGNRDIVEAFMQTHMDATLYVNGNDVGDIINAEISEVTGSEIAEEILGSALSRLVVTYEIPVSSIMDFAETSEREGFISVLPDDGLIDDSFLEQG